MQIDGQSLRRILRALLTGCLLAASAASLWAGEAARIVFVAGEAKVAGRAAQLGAAVREGEALATGKDGYLYLKTIDNGFLILRPQSQAEIVTYRVADQASAETRIKLELRHGVARHISGDAVHSARQNFRFNTPVAAIGVRGTDFSVMTDSDTTRVAVLSGGVVVSPFNESCAAAGLGPCEGPVTRELYAKQADQILLVRQGQIPLLLQGKDLSPDTHAPPRHDEPPHASGSHGKTSRRSPGAPENIVPDANLEPIRAGALFQLAAGQVRGEPVTVPPLIWGRWEALLGQGVEVDVQALQANHQLIATNSHFALMRSREAGWQPPPQSALGFALRDAQAVIVSEPTRTIVPAQVANGRLDIDFARSAFFTQFDLVAGAERFNLQTRGELDNQGRLYGGNQFNRPNNMDVRGALGHDNMTAAYLFQSRLDEQRVGNGVLFWGR